MSSENCLQFSQPNTAVEADILPVYWSHRGQKAIILLRIFFFKIQVMLIDYVVLVSDGQRSDLVLLFFFFFRFFPLYIIIQYRVSFPVLYSRSLLVIYFIHSRVYLLILNASFIPSPPFRFANHKFVF